MCAGTDIYAAIRNDDPANASVALIITTEKTLVFFRHTVACRHVLAWSTAHYYLQIV